MPFISSPDQCNSESSCQGKCFKIERKLNVVRKLSELVVLSEFNLGSPEKKTFCERISLALDRLVCKLYKVESISLAERVNRATQKKKLSKSKTQPCWISI